MSVSAKSSDHTFKNYSFLAKTIYNELTHNQYRINIPPLHSIDELIEFIKNNVEREHNWSRLKYFLLHEQELYDFDGYYNFNLRNHHPLMSFFLDPQYRKNGLVDHLFVERVLYNRYLFTGKLNELVESDTGKKCFLLDFRDHQLRKQYCSVIANSKAQALAKFLLSGELMEYDINEHNQLQDPLNIIVYDSFYIWELEQIPLPQNFGEMILELSKGLIAIEEIDMII